MLTQIILKYQYLSDYIELPILVRKSYYCSFVLPYGKGSRISMCTYLVIIEPKIQWDVRMIQSQSFQSSLYIQIIGSNVLPAGNTYTHLMIR